MNPTSILMAVDSILGSLVLDALAATAGILVAGTVLTKLPFHHLLTRLLATIRKSFSVIASRHISEHWKERAVPTYALRVFAGSVKLTLMIALVLAAFIITFIVAYAVVTLDFDTATVRIMHWQPQLIACVIGVVWWSVQPREEPQGNYSPMERALHELTVGNPGVSRLAFTIECKLTKPVEANSKPVYITGLARSGTTLLLDALVNTDDFTSMSYRNMPFVTAPRLWSRISRPFARTSEKRERAHGDGMLVDADSPEAFEEVFWLMRCGADYVKQLGLQPHAPSKAAIADYRRFVGNVLVNNDYPGQRYLSKSNNNLLRLGSLIEAFPDATIIVPFRHPIDQAESLLRQHLRFLDIHGDDEFSHRYMNWLGHFEFGANFRPFLFDDSAIPGSPDELKTRDYWLRYWTSVYRHVTTCYRDRVILFDHDRFVADPATELGRLGARLGIEPDKLSSFASHVRRQNQMTSMEECPEQTIAVFETCREIARR